MGFGALQDHKPDPPHYNPQIRTLQNHIHNPFLSEPIAKNIPKSGSTKLKNVENWDEVSIQDYDGVILGFFQGSWTKGGQIAYGF